jgi:hypothetical protein
MDICKAFVLYMLKMFAERRQERRFNRKGVVMNIHRAFEDENEEIQDPDEAWQPTEVYM